MEDRKIQNEDPSTSKLVSRVKWTTIPLEKCIIHGLTCALTTPHGVFQINASSHARPILGTSIPLEHGHHRELSTKEGDISATTFGMGGS